MSGGNGLIGRSVTSKVTSILDAFRASEQQLSLAEISARTGMPLSTTHRLANELVRWGGLERSQRGTYRPVNDQYNESPPGIVVSPRAAPPDARSAEAKAAAAWFTAITAGVFG